MRFGCLKKLGDSGADGAAIIREADATGFEKVRDRDCGFGKVVAGVADGEHEVAESEGAFRCFEVLVHLEFVVVFVESRCECEFGFSSQRAKRYFSLVVQ